MRFPSLTALITVVALALVVAACGGPRETAPALSPPGGDPATAPPTGESNVTIQGNSFEPESVTVPRGGTVTWQNDDQAEHTVSHGTGGDLHGSPLFDMPLSPGTTASFTFAEAGSFPVTCKIHPEMQMDVDVTP